MRSIVLVAYNALRLLTWPLRALYGLRYRRRPRWVRLRVHGKVDELPQRPRRLVRLLRGAGEARSVLAARRLADRAAEDAALEGVLLHIEQLEASQATLSALRHEIARLRECGKKVVCYLPFGGDHKELYLASVGDRALAMPHAGLTALGPLAVRTYLAPLLHRVGIDLVVTAEGRYKTAAESLLRDTMSEPEREQLGAIVKTHLEQWLAALSSRPALREDGARRLLERGVFGAGEAAALGAIDGVAYEDELRAELGLGEREQVIDHDAYLKRPRAGSPLFVPLRPRSRVAVVRLVGAIGAGSTGRGIEYHGTASLLRKLARDPQICGVILHIDSPGGSALVSELLHREIARLDAKKPVVTWMGGVAASGGYYLAAATRAIIAQPATLTGSIGVISLRPVARRLLDRFEIRREVVGLTPHADLHSFARAPTEAEQALLKADSERFYARFLDVVAAGRGRPREEIAVLAEGRVWSGSDAHERGLVDALGGYQQARAALDRFLDVGEVEREPLLVMPPLRQTKLAFPASTLRGELDVLRDLLALSRAGEHVLAYALGLPQL